MRINYNNLIDDLGSSLITASTEETLYEATNVQDQRLTTQWRTTACTDQSIIFDASSNTIVGGNIGLVTGSAATNLVTDPEDFTTASWGKTGCTVSADTAILGITSYKITASGTATTAIFQTVPVTATTFTVTAIARFGNVATDARISIYDASASSTLASADITFSSKTISYGGTGSAGIPAQWIDDDTVRIYMKVTGATVANNNQLYIYTDTGPTGAIAGSYTYWTAAMVINNTYPVPYVATSRTAVNTSYSFRLPPSGKFIVDCEFFPYFAYDVSDDPNVWSFYIDGTHRLTMEYETGSDVFRVFWVDGGTGRTLTSQQFYASTLNTYIRLTNSFDLSASNGSAYYFVDGVLIDSTWSDAIDVLSSTGFTTIEVAQENNTARVNGIFRNFKVLGGSFSSTTATAITSETSLDTALEDHTLLLDNTYQNQFYFDTVAIMGHNISEGASITMQANNYNEWNYTDGSGSSIIQETLTWDDETILKMRTKSKKQYIKFSINDPNNDDGIIKTGRIWAGPYLDIDPSSLDDFQVTKRRSDRNIYSRDRVKWSDVGVGWRRFELRFPRTATTMLEKIQTMYDEVGNHTSIIFCNFDTLRDYEIVEPCYCSIDGDIVFNHRGRQKYTYSLLLEEDL